MRERIAHSSDSCGGRKVDRPISVGDGYRHPTKQRVSVRRNAVSTAGNHCRRPRVDCCDIAKSSGSAKERTQVSQGPGGLLGDPVLGSHRVQRAAPSVAVVLCAQMEGVDLPKIFHGNALSALVLVVQEVEVLLCLCEAADVITHSRAISKVVQAAVRRETVALVEHLAKLQLRHHVIVLVVVADVAVPAHVALVVSFSDAVVVSDKHFSDLRLLGQRSDGALLVGQESSSLCDDVTARILGKSLDSFADHLGARRSFHVILPLFGGNGGHVHGDSGIDQVVRELGARVVRVVLLGDDVVEEGPGVRVLLDDGEAIDFALHDSLHAHVH